MENNIDIKSSISRVIKSEALALDEVAVTDYPDIDDVIHTITNCKNKIVFVGVGKSGIVSKKVSATFNSLGIMSYFLYASELLHGDLGAIGSEDIVIIISKSGNSEEIINVLPHLKKRGIMIIGLTTNKNSILHNSADLKIVLPPVKEADYSNLVPTSGTTAQMAMGDAIALTVANMRGFGKENFAEVHPGGTLGKRLNVKIKDIMTRTDHVSVSLDASLKEIIYTISSGRVGACAVLDSSNTAIGIITDGDLRRMLENDYSIDVRAEDIMSPSPKALQYEQLAVDALELMEHNKISQILVLKEAGFKGIIHLHDCLQADLKVPGENNEVNIYK